MNGTTQNAESSAAIPATDNPHLIRRRSLQISIINPTPMNTNMRTTPWHSAAKAVTTAASIRRSPVYIPWANRPNPIIANVSAIENENSPAIVEAILPP